MIYLGSQYLLGIIETIMVYHTNSLYDLLGLIMFLGDI